MLLCLQGSLWMCPWSSSPCCSKQSCTPANPVWAATGPASHPVWPAPLETRHLQPHRKGNGSSHSWMWQAATLFLKLFFSSYIYYMTELNVCWFKLHICTKQMLTADASVVGVYKCLCSLLNVLVLRLLEIGFKRVYFIQTGGFGSTRDECFQTSPGKCCCVQVRFCCGTMSCQSKQIHWDVLAFRRRLNVKRKQHKSKRSVWINWDRKICQTKLLYLHGPWLPTRGRLVSFAFHEVAVVSLSDVCCKYGSIRVLLQS